MKNPIMTLIVHGGAYDIPLETHEAHKAGCRRAAEAGWALLANGESALDAVEAAVRVLEDDPTYDAGHGSFLNANGEVEMDAIVMDGRTLDFGAVAAVQRVCNPVTLARLVMTDSEHAMLAGAGAEAFARELGVPICPVEELVVERERERWRIQLAGTPHEWDGNVQLQDIQLPSDTVGAVAIDAGGNVATATSTGGTFNKHPGRVGDSPLVGCGAYADNRSGAASATGMGEALMKIVISKKVCDLIGAGMTAQAAVDTAIAVLAERTNGQGGVIAVDGSGRVGIAHNTPYIAHAYIAAGRDIVADIRGPKPPMLSEMNRGWQG